MRTKEKTVFVGLDIETTGIGSSPFVKTIELGLALPLPTGGVERLSLDIGWPDGEFAFQPGAREVNGFSDERVRRALSAEKVSTFFVEQLHVRRLRNLVAVGWDVGRFDLPLLSRDLPLLMNQDPSAGTVFFQRRSVDLNAICFFLGDMTGTGWKYWKDLAKEKSAEQARGLGWPDEPHAAGWDALTALLAFDILQEEGRAYIA